MKLLLPLVFHLKTPAVGEPPPLTFWCLLSCRSLLSSPPTKHISLLIRPRKWLLHFFVFFLFYLNLKHMIKSEDCINRGKNSQCVSCKCGPVAITLTITQTELYIYIKKNRKLHFYDQIDGNTIKNWTLQKWEMKRLKEVRCRGGKKKKKTHLCDYGNKQHPGTSHKTEWCTNKPSEQLVFPPLAVSVHFGCQTHQSAGSQGLWLLGDEILVGIAWLESVQRFWLPSVSAVAPDKETWCRSRSFRGWQGEAEDKRASAFKLDRM